MQRSGSTAPAVHDDGTLRRLLERQGPVVTIWANRPEPVPNAIASRLQSARDEIKDLLPSQVVDAVLAALGDAFGGSPGAVVVAGDDGIRLVEAANQPLHHEVTLFTELPALAALIEHRQADVPFVVATVDRRGADLAWSAGGRQGERTVEGDDTYITKVHAGGWSHRRFQQRAENSWEHTAAEIATELERLVRQLEPRVVIVASEERMEQMLRDRLPADINELLRDVSGSRTLDGSDDERNEQIERWIRTAGAEDTVAALELFDQERGQADRATSGAEDTFEALRASRVDTLLIHDDGTQERTAFFDREEPGLVALDRGTFEQLGREPAGPARLQDVAIRACLLTGAGLRIVPAHTRLDDDIGAILRW
jgi:hypothetical protein